MAGTTPTAFDLLHEKVKKWIWDQNWYELHAVQEQSIPVILPAAHDVLITAGTAGGKTEAAFLAIFSNLLANKVEGLGVVYLSPLKALINDQFDRLERMGEAFDIQVTRWHGDVAGSTKRQLLKHPSGVLLITPESLEALFARQGSALRLIFAGLRYLVVDELHSFLGFERGRQLQSLLARSEGVTRRRLPRIALSATLGDPLLGCEFLRPGAGDSVLHVAESSEGQDLQLQLKSYRRARPGGDVVLDSEEREPEREAPTASLIAGHLFETLRGRKNLIFANARSQVEEYSDRLRSLCESRRIPCEFWPHHGSLSKELREAAESALKEPARPATVICTSTLELGLDVGEISSVAQLGPPPSVAALRQRLGRSGRRGEPAVLRVYVQEAEIEPDSPPQDRLRASLVQTVAAIELLLEHWYEPPEVGALHLSTLVQQVLSIVAERGGVLAAEAWEVLCCRGPFRSLSKAQFAQILRCLGRQDLLVQTHNQELVLGLVGERVVNHFSFYSAFSTPEEYRVLHAGRELGTLPMSSAVYTGLLILFGGRRWRVLACDEQRRVLDVAPAPGGRPPIFGGNGGRRHDEVLRRMHSLYSSAVVPAYLDRTSRDLLLEGRENFLRLELDRRALCEWGSDCLLFPWRGDRVLDTLAVWLTSLCVEAAADGIALLLPKTSAAQARELLTQMAEREPPSCERLAENVRNLRREKHHLYLDESLLRADYGSANLAPAEAQLAAAEMLARGPSESGSWV